MRTLRKLQLWAAERDSRFDQPGIYRRPPRDEAPKASPIDRLLIGFAGLVLLLFGMFGMLAALFVLWAILATIF